MSGRDAGWSVCIGCTGGDPAGFSNVNGAKSALESQTGGAYSSNSNYILIASFPERVVKQNALEFDLARPQ
jgi:hypothetical protein